MNADAFRHLYEYHFAENRVTWEKYIMPLTQEQFIQRVDYSLGSLRNHIVHLTEVDNIWFSELTGLTDPAIPFIEDTDDRTKIRQHWDTVEAMMRDYLAGLRDEILMAKPIVLEEDKDLSVWQVLLHVVNHGTDHRAQMLRLLHDLGASTVSQDYIFFAYDHPV